jgi:hypothetical protein
MKLRLTQPGFEGYSAQMGVVFFENGLSTTDVSPHDAIRMAAVMGCEWEDGSPANVGQMYLDGMNAPAPSDQEQRDAHGSDADGSSTDDSGEQGSGDVVKQAGVSYTEEQLAAIADDKGITGLRDIADPLGIKGNSIRGLIDAIVKAAGAPKTE